MVSDERPERQVKAWEESVTGDGANTPWFSVNQLTSTLFLPTPKQFGDEKIVDWGRAQVD